MLANLRKVIPVAILSVLLLFVSAGTALAQDPAEVAVRPDIVVQTDDQLVFSFSGKVADKESALAELEAAAAKLSEELLFARQRATWEATPTPEGGGGRGQYNLADSDSKEFEDGDVMASFSTWISWTDLSISGFGSSSAAWTGTEPDPDCDAITTDHTVHAPLALWNGVPSGWTGQGTRTAQGSYLVYDTWYQGTSWSQLTGVGVPTVAQGTTSVFYWTSTWTSLTLHDS